MCIRSVAVWCNCVTVIYSYLSVLKYNETMELKPITRQCFYASSSLLNLFSMGLVYGYPAILIPYLKDKNSDIHADLDVITWLVAIPGVFALTLNILVGPLMNKWGRRKTHILITSCGLIGWILAAFSYSIYPLFLARAFHGIMKGGIHFCGICIAEFTAPKVRGPLLTLKLMAMSVGTASAHAIGLFVHWRHLALVGIAVSSLSLIINVCWSESPEWLVLTKRFEEAETTFFKLRCRNVDTESELARMIANQQMKQTSKINIFRTVISKPFLKIAALVTSKQMILEFGGRHFFPAYLIETISEITGNDKQSTIYVIALDCICIVAGLISYILVRRFSRRSLLINTGAAGVFIMLSLCLTLFLYDKYFHTNTMMFISAGLIGLYFAVVFSSTFTICYVIAGELWPLDFRHIGLVYQSLNSSVFFTAWMKIVPYLKLHLHVYGFLTLGAVLMLIMLLYLYKNLPETKDKTLHDISEHFQGKIALLNDEETQTIVCTRCSNK